jgi:flagellar basal-body rod protein FlgB
MTIDIFRDPTIKAMDSYMTRVSQRLQIISSNLSNRETPGYKTKDVSFHATMEELLSDNSLEPRSSNSDGIKRGVAIPMRAQSFEVQGLETDPKGNNVNLDNEMVKLSETSIGYAFITQMLKGKFRTIANSINEGRG